MKKDFVIVFSIFMLFAIVFVIGNRHHFLENNDSIVKQGMTVVSNEQLENNNTIKLNGDWSFYPNVMISPQQSLDDFEERRISMKVPDKWEDYFQFNEKGPLVGTYHLVVKVPAEGQYGLFFRYIHSSSRVFINGINVGGKGNPSTSFSSFQSENDDTFIVIGESKEQELDILIQVASYNKYPTAGIIYPVEFGTRENIQNFYDHKRLIDVLVIFGYIVFGIIYLTIYGQSRKRKEELFFGLYMLLIGFQSSFTNHKIFFQVFPIEETFSQSRLQLGVIPLIDICQILFLYTMYPQVANKKIVNTIVISLGCVFFLYGIYNPFYIDTSEMTAQAMIIRQVTYVALIILLTGYTQLILIRVILKKLEGARYILIIFAGGCCYALLVIINFLTEVPNEYSKLVFLGCTLVGFTLLLNYRMNQAFTDAQTLSKELLVHNQMKDEFLLKTSHELRTPLNGILNLSKSLMEGAEGPLKRTQQEQVILIHNVTQRLGYLVEDLLFSSNYMSGEIRVSPRTVAITVINEVVAEIRSVMSTNSHVRLLVEVDLTLPPMLTDELRFKQVLYNLLHNAIQHTEIGEITVTAYQQEKYMVIEVSDTGKGIPAQDLERIFNSFYQVKNNHQKEGLGIGLSIAKNIVDKLNGDIYVKSTLGEGTTFTFTMPLATEEQVGIENSFAIASRTNASKILQLELPLIHNGNDKKILVVDDDHVNIKVLADVLALKGYTVIGVDNGFDAIDYIKTNQVDCMLVDLMMEGMSGYELCKQVRKQYDMLELPIIVLTAIMKHSDLVLTLQVGANDYLRKPVATDELLIRIESLLAVRQSSIDAIEVEMNYLYAQVTPHFVYNTLNTIIGLSYSDMDNTREALYCLATYFRAKLNVHYRNSMVLIEEELELVKAYLYIEKMRFGNRLTVKYDIDESIQLMIPALSLQPLVENAVFHGISKKPEGGTIEVSVQREGQFVRIKIQDNGVGIPAKKLQQLINEESSRIGFTNPLKKFKLMKNASLRLNSEEGKGTTILILLPKGDGA
ncbi:ATP-binding protein [Lysinibacillus sp. RC79]|uniref:sensor histidine kinase n=1 Tax=Lysinibacillus sp. RC79 TaxID=3156296 RepID=UPI003511C4B5